MMLSVVAPSAVTLAGSTVSARGRSAARSARAVYPSRSTRLVCVASCPAFSTPESAGMLSRALRTIDGGKCLGVNAPVVSAPLPPPPVIKTAIKSPVERAQDPRFAAATQEEAKMDAMRAAARKRIAGEADADPAAPVPDFDDLEPVASASSGSSLDAGTVIDTGAVWRYFLCTAVQFSVLVWFSMWLNVGLARSNLDMTYQKALVGVWFGFNALKSRVFSPLNASRPKMEGEKTAIKERRRPAWMPPPLAFPVIWTTIAVLRAVSSVVVFGTTGTLNNPAHFAMLLHLSVGDTWNSINNAEKRLGTAVVGVCAVLASVYNVVYQYWSVSVKAGVLIAPSAVWISVATLLVYTIWKINPRADGTREPLWPMKPALIENP